MIALKRVLFHTLSLSFLSLFLAGCTTPESGKSKVALFNGTNLDGWRRPTGKWQVAGSVSIDPQNPHQFVIHPGTGIFVNALDGKDVHLFSDFAHGDVQAHVEFVVSSNSNSGIYFQSRYELQIFDSWGVKEPAYHDCGGIYQRWINGKGEQGHAPRLNASRRPGAWQTFDVIFRAPRFDAAGKKIENARFVKVIQNGKLIHENVEVTGPTRSPGAEKEAALGALMIQGNHGPVALRNLWLKPLALP